ncbi:MAG: FtsX-like permease family protein [Methylococcales bacterium]
MASILNKSSRNFLWRHPWQLALAILGIALGVAVVISIDLAMESSLKAFEQAGKAFSGIASHRIMASDGGIDEKIYSRLRVEQGIKNIMPVVSGYVQLEDDNFKLIGIDPFVEQSMQAVWQQSQNTGDNSEALTRLVSEANSVLISAQTAQRLNSKVNDALTIRTANGKQKLKIVGLLNAGDAVSEQVLAKTLITDIATAQELLHFFNRLSSIEVLLDPDQSAATSAKISKLLPANALLTSASEQGHAMREMTQAFAINLRALGLLSLLVGMFLIYNTMTFLVIQRRRLIGNLRLIGVTRREIFRLILSEAMLLAVLGTVIGIVLGIILGQGLLYLISETINAIYFRIDASSLIISSAQLSKGLALGLGATFLAVLMPAWEATHLSPATVVIRSQIETGVKRLAITAALVSFLVIAAAVALIFSSGKSVSFGLLSIFLLLFGFALLTPLFTLFLMKSINLLLRRFVNILTLLPVRMVSAEISRTGIAVAALMIAVSATIGMDLMIGSFRQTVADWVRASLRADFYVSLTDEVMTTGKTDADNHLKQRLAKLEGVTMLSTALHTKIIADEAITKVSVFELNEKSKLSFLFKHPVADDIWQRFSQQQSVFVTEPYAYHHNIKIGQQIQLQTDEGKQAFTVLAIYADYSGDQGHLAMSRDNYRLYWPDLGYSGIGVYIKPGVDLHSAAKLINKQLTAKQSLKSDQEIYTASMAVFEQTFLITETLRWLSAGIAFVGVFSALMALQFERTRQLGVLRAIGVTPRQLSLLITGETGLMGLIAGLLAIPVGYLVAYILIFVIYQRSFGWTMAFHNAPYVIYQGFGLAFVAALLAGVVPALKMSKTNPAQALRTE